jgi:hypothetical protein
MSQMITQSRLTIGGVDLKTPRLFEPPPRVSVGTPPEKITVACVYWGNKYSMKYVENLRNMVARHLTVPYELVCVTDRTQEELPEGVKAIPTPMANEVCRGKNHYGDGKGWWAKVGLFKPGLFGDAKRIMYFDIDICIIGNLDKIASVQEPFCMIENFGPNKGHAAHNSSVVVWTPSEETDAIYEKFTPDVTKELHGDQCWTWRVMRNNIHDYPKNWVVSYKYEKHPQWRHRDKDTAIIIFHGKPNPHEVRDPIIINNWK